jgi:ribokinase
MPTPGQVLVVGSVNLDATLSMARIPAAGETVGGAKLSHQQGGVGANQAVAAARSGADTELVAALGTDAAAETLLGALRDSGVGVERCHRLDDVASGQASIWVDESGENRIVVAGGANERLDADAVRAALEGLSPAVVLCQLETPVEAAAAALAWARDNGALGMLNASPAMPVAELPRGAAVIVVNEGEARSIAASVSGVGSAGEADSDGEPNASADRDGEQADDGADVREQAEADAETIATALSAETVVVTLGGEGAIARHAGETLAARGPKVEPVDTTGAGDAFTGALAARLAAGDELADALTFACAVGALATTGVGATAAVPTAAETEAFLRDGALS